MRPSAEAGKPGSGWGGRRSGSGRKPKNRAALPDIDIQHALAAPPPEEIEAAAQRHAPTALGALVKLLIAGQNESARISAANTILDRGWGKPAVDVGGFAQLPLFGGVSMKPIGGEMREAAKKYANLAIETLRSIADNGRAEGARAAAAKSILDRGLGTVAPAKIDEAMRPVPPQPKAAEPARSKWDALVH